MPSGCWTAQASSTARLQQAVDGQCVCGAMLSSTPRAHVGERGCKCKNAATQQVRVQRGGAARSACAKFDRRLEIPPALGPGLSVVNIASDHTRLARPLTAAKPSENGAGAELGASGRRPGGSREGSGGHAQRHLLGQRGAGATRAGGEAYGQGGRDGRAMRCALLAARCTFSQYLAVPQLTACCGHTSRASTSQVSPVTYTLAAARRRAQRKAPRARDSEPPRRQQCGTHSLHAVRSCPP